MTTSSLVPVTIGASVTVALYIVIQGTINRDSRLPSRVIGLFAGLIGILVTLWLQDDPSSLSTYTQKIAVAGLAILLALLAAIGRRL
jgi:Mn2+/Fe2+ NRAMP family transporter